MALLAERDHRRRRFLDRTAGDVDHRPFVIGEHPPREGEFAVVDVVTKEKAWFEMPYGATPEIVRALIEGHFDAPAFRVGPKLWFV